METDALNVIAAVIRVAALVLGGWWLWQRRRTNELREQYANEYDRTVATLGRRRGEADLVRRQDRVRELVIRPLSAAERQAFIADWRRVQEQFVDDPEGAVTSGNRLVDDVMHSRGYPVADFERRVEDLSVDHPRVVENYRAARVIATRHSHGRATTEELRQAMVLYRELFDELLSGSNGPVHEREVSRPIARGDAPEVADRRQYPDSRREVRP
jgi:hypothetical protein